MDKQTALPQGVKIPEHIAIIMDGNGRWAKERGLPRTDGHIQGREALRKTLEAAVEFGVACLTVYAFSTENWHRPQEEVDLLMNLLVEAITNETEEMIKQGVKVVVIGDRSRLPNHIRGTLEEALARTAQGERITLCVALSYSGRDELVRAVSAYTQDRVEGRVSVEQGLSEDLLSTYLDTADLPQLDLMIRTGKEMRVSNFLLWQLAYAELYFSDCYWPDFDREALLEAIVAYSDRERRYGKISEQLI